MARVPTDKLVLSSVDKELLDRSNRQITILLKHTNTSTW